MAFSSPASRGSPASNASSPKSPADYNIRFRVRNSEDIHNDILAAAQVEHQRVRNAALRAFQLNEERLAQLKISEEATQEEERVQIKAQRALDEQRLRAARDKAKRIQVAATPRQEAPQQAKVVSAPIQPTPVQKPAPIQTTTVQQASIPPPAPAIQKPELSASLPSNPPASLPPSQPSILPQPTPFAQNAPATNTPFTSTTQDPVKQPNASSLSTITPTTSAPIPQSHLLPHVDRYVQIHKTLKDLRKFVSPALPRDEQARQLKKKAGEMRRTIKSSIGQLTGEKGANRLPLNKIKDLLREARDTFPSPPIDPSTVLISTPPKTEGASNNTDTLPALFIYALNMLGKVIVAQFLNEAGVAPETADPIGIIAVSIFAQSEFCWRGHTLISILIAKFRIVCPVLFGVRGSEKTKEGRLRLGWQQLTDDDGNPTDGWISEQEHNARMTGMGAGYASISLRDFSKASMRNPWPPTNYWQTMASITSTPPEQMSSTQFIVLKAMIENYEQRFLSFFGSCAKAALKVAVVEFPAKSTETNAAVSSLKVLADKWRRDTGLDLER